MSNNEVTKDDVKRVAELSGFELSNEEIARFSEMFTDTLAYMDTLSELDTSDVRETYQVTGLTNVFQEETDKSTTLSQADSLRNANETKDNLFVTEAVFER